MSAERAQTEASSSASSLIATMRTAADWRAFLHFAEKRAHRAQNLQNLLFVYHRFGPQLHPDTDHTPAIAPGLIAELTALTREAGTPEADTILTALDAAARGCRPAPPRPRPSRRRARRRPRQTTTGDNQLVAHTSRGPLPFTLTTDWATGRTRYRVEGIGVFIIEPNPSDYPAPARHLYIQYGDDAEPGDYRARNGYRPRPNAPVINTITLIGGAGVDPDRADPTRHHWLVVRRRIDDYSSRSAPDATALRTAQIVHALITHHQARPDLEKVKAAHARALAPARLRDHQRTIAHLTDRIAELRDQLAAAQHAADAQQALINTPLTP